MVSDGPIRPGFWRSLSAIALGVYLALWLCGGDREADAREADKRIYHRVTVAQMKSTKWTHVEVCGRVTLVKGEADGDLHVRLDDGGAFIVAETVPYHPLAAPRVGQRICVRGISRLDRTHGWYEVHPVESWTVQR